MDLTEIKHLVKMKSAKPRLKCEPHTVYKIKITLRNMPYNIWRVLLIEADVTINSLISDFLIAFEWEGCHLADLKINGLFYSWFNGYTDAYGYDATEYIVGEELSLGDKGIFFYDYTNSWEHDVVVQDIIYDSTICTPFCVKGKGKCPPDDCGGPWGFCALLNALNNPSTRNYDIYKFFFEEYGFDPNGFDIENINRSL